MNTATTLRLFVLFCISLWGIGHGPPVYAQSSPFTDCPDEPNVDNATVQFASDVAVEFPNGSDGFSTGDEIAFFTDEDVCAGRTVWEATDDQSRVLSISGPADAVDPSEIDGYADGEALRLSVWQQSTDRRFDVEPDAIGYASCGADDPLCRDDGQYESNVIFTVVDVGNGVLPVELSTFSLRLQGDRVQALWRTLSETNNSGFTLEHRRDTTGAWRDLGFIPGMGTTSVPQEYTFTTEALAYGTHQFRLLQHDHDGTTTAVANKQVVRHLTETPIVLSIAPQPVRGQATITLTTATAQRTRVELFDMLGRQIRLLHDGPLSPSTPHVISLSTNDLSSGQYMVRVQNGSDRLTQRIVVVR